MNFQSYKEKFPFDIRKAKVEHLQRSYPDRIPIVAEPYRPNWLKSWSKETTPCLANQKFLAPRHLNFGQFVYIIRSKIKLPDDTALYFFINNELIPPSSLLFQIYEQHKEDCGTLFILYSTETTFG